MPMLHAAWQPLRIGRPIRCSVRTAVAFMETSRAPFAAATTAIAAT